MTFDDLPDELKQTVANELEPGEQVTWAGRPGKSPLRHGNWAIVLFGIPWTAFALFWTAAASGIVFGGGPPGIMGVIFPLFGLPFILIGCGMLSAPFWSGKMLAGTAYVVTDRRAILFQRVFHSTTVRSFPPDRLRTLYRSERADGSGDIVFEETAYRDSDGDRRVSRVGFFGVEDVRQVEGMLKELAAKAGQ